MSLTTYAGLQAAVAVQLGNRNDLTAQIQDWIYLCEQELNNVLSRREMMQRATTNTVADQESYALPTDFGGAISLHINGSPIIVADATDWDRVAARYQGQTGTPTEWCINMNEIMLGPTPSGVYQMELYYTKAIPNLSIFNTTNWLLTAHPSIYFYGTLNHAARGIVIDDATAAKWVQSYDGAVKKLIMRQVKDRGFGGAPLLTTCLPFGYQRGGYILTGE